MASVIDDRMSAEMDGEFVVFLIGVRINKFWKIHKWLPVLRAMTKMREELTAHPESGFLGRNGAGPISVQYWRTLEQLEYYARDTDKERWPAWVDFKEKLEQSHGDVGVWSESYVIKPGQYKASYSGVPAVGLGKVGRLVPVKSVRQASDDPMKTEVA